MEVSDARRLKALEDKNAKLKRLLAEAMLDNAHAAQFGRKKMVTPRRQTRSRGSPGRDPRVSQRRAC
jgi:hypothetical protein